MDADEHESAQAYRLDVETPEEHEEDVYDDYRYGEESGEAYEDG